MTEITVDPPHMVDTGACCSYCFAAKPDLLRCSACSESHSLLIVACLPWCASKNLGGTPDVNRCSKCGALAVLCSAMRAAWCAPSAGPVHAAPSSREATKTMPVHATCLPLQATPGTATPTVSACTSKRPTSRIARRCKRSRPCRSAPMQPRASGNAVQGRASPLPSLLGNLGNPASHIAMACCCRGRSPCTPLMHTDRS